MTDYLIHRILSAEQGDMEAQYNLGNTMMIIIVRTMIMIIVMIMIVIVNDDDNNNNESFDEISELSFITS